MKKRYVWLIPVLLLLILAAGGAMGGYYFYQRQLSEKTVEDFLSDMQKMDFDKMAAHLQSSDLSALDNADIRNKAYEDFFRQINRKMSYEILENSFDFQNGTAKITVRIKYIDGSKIYQEAISEFLRQIVSAALSGEEAAGAQTRAQEQLASILTEKAGSIEDTFTETELVYPLIRENGVWKIVSLNDDTVKIMSANFKNAAEEIHKTLNGPSPTEKTPQTEASDENEKVPLKNSDSLHLTSADFTIQYKKHKIETDFTGKPCLLFYYDYSNTSDSPSSAMVDINLQAFQDGAELDAAILEKTEKAADRFFHEVHPGETVTICQVFSLNGSSDVTIQAESASSSQEETASQILKIK